MWNGNNAETVGIVSPRTQVDAFGRNVQSFFSTTVPLAELGRYSSALGLPQSTTTYDALDRLLSVRLADGATTTNAYAIKMHQGEPMLETTTTDALGRSAEAYADAKGRTQETVAHDGATDIRVQTAYNALGEVVAVTHPNGRITSYTYDALNRLTSASGRAKRVCPSSYRQHTKRNRCKSLI